MPYQITQTCNGFLVTLQVEILSIRPETETATPKRQTGVTTGTAFPLTQLLPEEFPPTAGEKGGEKESEKKVTQRKEKEKGPEREGLGLASQLNRIADAWNRLPLQKVNRFTETRKARTEALLAQYPADEIIRAIESISHSRFLLGGGAKGWHIRFDWFIRPENFRKVLEGNYLDEEEESSIPCPATENCGAGQTPMFTAYNGSNQARLGYSEQDLQDINQLWTDSSDIKKGEPQ